MKKRYTKKQIMESIAYWKKQLKMKSLNESSFTCDPDENQACACYSYLHQAYESGDEANLHIGPNLKSVCNGMFEPYVNDGANIIISYNGNEANYIHEYNKFIKIFNDIYNSSKQKGDVKATIYIDYNNGEDQDEQNMTYNFYSCRKVLARNIFYCQ